jgi:dTMP kinase
MPKGMYIIFEGNDGAGKSTTMKAVGEAVNKRFRSRVPLHLTHHPGTTPLGAHIRKLVKFPKDIDPNIEIDSLSRQILYMVDTVSFIKQKLQPALNAGEIVFADRSSFISALVYGTAEGLDLGDIDRLFALITPPKADRLYILRCPWEVGKERLKERAERADHFERKPAEFFQRLERIYDSLLTGPVERTMLVSKSVNLENVVYIDSTLPLTQVVDTIVKDLMHEAARLGIRLAAE